MTIEDTHETTPTGRAPGARRGRGWGTILRWRDAFLARPTWQRWLIAVPSGALVACIAIVGVDVAAAAGRIHPGVSVGTVDVGGLSTEAASDRLVAELSGRLEVPVHVTFEGQTWDVTSTDVSATLDPAVNVDEAYQLGRRGSLWRRVRERVGLWLAGVELAPAVATESTATEALLDVLDEQVGVAPVDASVAIDGTEVTVMPSSVGREVDREGAVREILSAFISDARTFELPTRMVPVAVTDSDAQVAADVARVMVSAPVVLEYEQDSWTIEPAEIATWIGFEAVPHRGEEATSASIASGTVASSESTSVALQGRMVLEAYLMATEVSRTVSPLTSDIGRQAKDAEFLVRTGVVSVVPAEVGLGVDIEAVRATLELALLEEDSLARTVALRMQAVQPELTTEEAQAMGVNERLATYTTTFASSNKPRANNIQTLARALDGTLIAPGESFSFNDTIGPRTAEKGYQEAGTIVNGQLVPTLGGGICQVCTTLFNSVFFAGLPVDQRSNHSFYISSYPTGRDATVSWGGPDFEFTNDTSAWILIATGYTSSSVTISLYGTDPGYEVDHTTGSWTDVRKFTTKTVEDDELDEGVRIVESGGVDGRTIVVTRRIYQDGDLVREDSFRSKYNPKQEIVRVGTRPIPGSSEGTATAE